MKADVRLKMPKTIAVDLDKTLHDYHKGWHDGSIYGEPIEGMRELIHDLRELGIEIVIFSVRCFTRVINGEVQPDQCLEVIDWLKKHNIEYDKIEMTGKPICDWFLDDRAIRFIDAQQARRDLYEVLEIGNGV